MSPVFEPLKLLDLRHERRVPPGDASFQFHSVVGLRDVETRTV
jgi:hypothetical protein